VHKNYQTLKALCYALNANKFSRISTCEIAKKVWHTLMTIYEGINQFRE